jgi:disulfide bond formation protein DsbB
VRPATVTTFFALLALASYAVVVAAVLLAVLSGRVAAVAALRERAADALSGPALGFAIAVTGVATVGSLYLSEGIGYPPCGLCWVQRGFMYPLAVVLLVAAVLGRHGLRRGAALWALAGGAVAAYHVAVERFPGLSSSTVCSATTPCTVRWVEHFGFVTIPVMALAAFLLAAVLLLVRAPVGETADHDTLEPVA